MNFYNKLSGKVKMGLKFLLVAVLSLCVPGLNVVIFLSILELMGWLFGVKTHAENNGILIGVLCGSLYLLISFLLGYLFGKNVKPDYEEKN